MICTYGPDPDQYAELRRPGGDPLGVAVVIHGGFWRAAYDASLGRELASDLTERGWTTYNVEYRRVGGRWMADHAAGRGGCHRPALRTRPGPLAVVAIGHSAGGHLAAWAAGRPSLPPAAPGSSPRVMLTGVVAQAGVLDLRTGAARGVEAPRSRTSWGAGPRTSRNATTGRIRSPPCRSPCRCCASTVDPTTPSLSPRARPTSRRRGKREATPNWWSSTATTWRTSSPGRWRGKRSSARCVVSWTSSAGLAAGFTARVPRAGSRQLSNSRTTSRGWCSRARTSAMRRHSAVLAVAEHLGDGVTDVRVEAEGESWTPAPGRRRTPPSRPGRRPWNAHHRHARGQGLEGRPCPQWETTREASLSSSVWGTERARPRCPSPSTDRP